LLVSGGGGGGGGREGRGKNSSMCTMLCTGEEDLADDWRETTCGGAGSLPKLPEHLGHVGRRGAV